MTWQIETAQKNLADLVERANAEGPQVLSRKGRKVAVVLAYNVVVAAAAWGLARRYSESRVAAAVATPSA